MSGAILREVAGIGTVLAIDIASSRLTFSLESLPLLLGKADLFTLKVALAAALDEGDRSQRPGESDGEHIARMAAVAAGIRYQREA